MLAEWEAANGLNPGIDDSGDDPDGDDLTNIQEQQFKTNPQSPDSDGDAMPDGWEVSNSLNPLVDDAFDDALLRFDQHALREQNLVGPAAEWIEFQESLFVDRGDDETDLVAMSGQQDGGVFGVQLA